MADFDKLILELQMQNKSTHSTLLELQNDLKGVAATLNSAMQPLNSFNRNIGNTIGNSAKKAKGELSGLRTEINALAQRYRALGDTTTAKKLSGYTKSLGKGTLQEQQSKVLASLSGAGYGNTIEAQGIQSATLSVKQFDTEVKKSAKSVATLDKSTKKSFLGAKNLFDLSKIGLTLFSVRKIANVFTSSMKEAIDYVETLNLFSTALGDNLGKATDFVGDMATNLGLSYTTLMRYQGLFYQMTTSMGLANDQAYTLSESFTSLANDIASYYNISITAANEKLQSALAGQIRPLRELGIDISKTALEEEARLRGIDESIEKMTQAEKVQLRYLAVMRQTRNAQGDYVKTMNTAANQLKILSEQTIEAKRAWGEVFMPILQAILPIVNGLVMGFTVLGKSLQAVTGYKATINANTLNSLEALDVDAEEAANSVNSLQKATMGIDELNVLSNSSNTSTDPTADWTLDLESYNSGLEDTTAVIESLGAAGKAVYNVFDGIGNVIEFLSPVIKGVGTALLLTFGVKTIQSLGFALFKNLINVNFNTPLDASLKAVQYETKAMNSMTGSLKSMGTGFMNFIKANWIFLTISAVVALYTAFKKFIDEKQAKLLEEALGGVSLSAKEMAKVLSGTNQELTNLYNASETADSSLETVQTSMDNAKDSSDSFWDSLNKIDNDIAGQMDNVTTEVDKMTEAMKTGFSDKQELILTAWEDMFTASGDRIDSDEQALLDKIKLQGTSAEIAIQEIGTQIKDIYAQMATDATTSVDEQMAKIKQLQQLQWNIANADTIVSEKKEAKDRQSLLEKIQSGSLSATGEGSYQDLGEQYLSSLTESINQFNELLNKRQQDVDVATYISEQMKTAGYTDDQLISMGYDSKTIAGLRSELESWATEQKSQLQSANILTDIIAGLQSKIVDIPEGATPYIPGMLPEEQQKYIDSFNATIEANKQIQAVIDELMKNYGSMPDINGYATGGYVDRGEIFRANESGNIEAMGTVGGKTAVMNNQTLASAFGAEIYPALYNAIVDGFSGTQNGGGDVVIQIDGREIARATKNGTRLTGGTFSTANNGGVL